MVLSRASAPSGSDKGRAAAARALRLASCGALFLREPGHSSSSSGSPRRELCASSVTLPAEREGSAAVCRRRHCCVPCRARLPCCGLDGSGAGCRQEASRCCMRTPNATRLAWSCQTHTQTWTPLPRGPCTHAMAVARSARLVCTRTQKRHHAKFMYVPPDPRRDRPHGAYLAHELPQLALTRQARRTPSRRHAPYTQLLPASLSPTQHQPISFVVPEAKPAAAKQQTTSGLQRLLASSIGWRVLGLREATVCASRSAAHHHPRRFGDGHPLCALARRHYGGRRRTAPPVRLRLGHRQRDSRLRSYACGGLFAPAGRAVLPPTKTTAKPA